MSNIVPLISILSLIDLVGDLGTSFLDVKEEIDSEDSDLLWRACCANGACGGSNGGRKVEESRGGN